MKRSICTPQKAMEKQKKRVSGVQKSEKEHLYPAEADGEAEKDKRRGTEESKGEFVPRRSGGRS